MCRFVLSIKEIVCLAREHFVFEGFGVEIAAKLHERRFENILKFSPTNQLILINLNNFSAHTLYKVGIVGNVQNATLEVC